MTVQASGGPRQIERRRDAVLKPRPHIIVAIGGVPINGRLKPVVFSAVEISSPAVSRPNVIQGAADRGGHRFQIPQGDHTGATPSRSPRKRDTPLRKPYDETSRV